MLCLYFIIGKEKLLLPFSFIFNILIRLVRNGIQKAVKCLLSFFSFPCYTFHKDHDWRYSMDSKMLEAFIALYEKRSLRQAASALYISPQGLSRLLQNLEGELNVILFKRTARGIIPTAAGDYFYSQAVDMLASYRQLASNLQSISGMEKDLSFVCGYGAVNALPYQVLLDFQEAYPQYKISWREFPDLQAEQLLIKGDYHLGLLVMGNSRLQEQFVCQPLFERDILLLVYEGHPLYQPLL